MEKRKTRSLSYVVFALTLATVVISLIALVFPALITTLTSEYEKEVYFLELGAWAIPVVAINIAVFGFAIMYYSASSSSIIRKFIKAIVAFEVSSKVTTLTIVIILGVYISLTVNELTIYEGDEWEDFERIQNDLKTFPYLEQDFPSLRILYVKNFLLYSSQEVFKNIKIIPFIGSISLLLLTYFFTTEISKKRFAGLVAMVILLQSSTFLRYDTAATYSNFWTLFYVLSLYLTYKKWFLSHIAYFLSIFSKSLTLVFLPLSLFVIYNTNFSQKKRIQIMMPYLIIIIVAITVVMFVGEDFGINIQKDSFGLSFNTINFLNGFAALGFQLRFDGLVLAFLLPLTVALFLRSRKGLSQADTALVLILGTILSAPLLVAFTVFTIFPYRYIPVIVFFAVGVGTLLSKEKTTPQV